MTSPNMHRIVTVNISREEDVVLARQRARQIAAALGFDLQEQTRIATALSEIARNAYEYARSGKAEFAVSRAPGAQLVISVEDNGPGIRDIDAIMDGRYQSKTGMGLGMIGAKRLMESFDIRSAAGKGTTITMRKSLPKGAGAERINLDKIAASLTQSPAAPSVVNELQEQNRELLLTLEALRERQAELAQLNDELEDTNRGVVALYAELDDRAEYLRKASDIKTRFFSNISHELRTPLNSIISLANILLEHIDGDLSPEQEKQVSYIKRSGEELIELVSDLLDLAKVEAGKITVKPQEFEIANTFSALRGAIKPMLRSKPVELIFEDVDGLPSLNTDETKVAQILRNFLSNALKFTEHGEVSVSARMQDSHVIFEVRDSGVGIAPEDQEKVFEEWSQVDNPAQRRVKGSGLGLPLSRKLAELLGGRIWLESQVGKGSNFYLSVPSHYHGPSEVTFVSGTRANEQPSIPIMVIEDNFETLYSYEKYLQGSEFHVISAKTIGEARRKLRDLRPAVIIMDVLMGDELSWPLLKEIRDDPDTAEVPVIVITVVDNRSKAFAMGAAEFAVKPIERAWMLNRLRAIVAGRPAKRLLVIDDDEVSRYSLMAMIGNSNFSFVEAKNGSEGLQMLREIHPDGVILDLLMPEMNGFEFLKALRSDPEIHSTPVLVNTSKHLTNTEREFLQKNANGILSKGYSREDAKKAVDSVFGSLPAAASF
jgi:signal transduction histidine kinase/CheY-like chemotaxis protein